MTLFLYTSTLLESSHTALGAFYSLHFTLLKLKLVQAPDKTRPISFTGSQSEITHPTILTLKRTSK